MKIKINLSDKILLILAGFATIFVLIAIFVIENSLQQVLVLGAVVYLFSFITAYLISWRFSKKIIKLKPLSIAWNMPAFRTDIRIVA